MDTAVVDSKHRVRIPGLSPGVVVSYVDNGDGSFTLIKVKAETKEPFPKGSLLKYVDEWNKEMAPVAKKMKVPAPPKDWE